jgi:hypothetical protein
MFASPFWSLVFYVAPFYKDVARLSRAHEKKSHAFNWTDIFARKRGEKDSNPENIAEAGA